MSDSETDSSYERKIAKLANECLNTNTTSSSYKTSSSKKKTTSPLFRTSSTASKIQSSTKRTFDDNVSDPREWYFDETIPNVSHISKRTKSNSKSTSSAFSTNSAKPSVTNVVKSNKRGDKQISDLKKELQRTKFERTVYQAIIRQYRQKMKNIRKVATAGIHRDDVLMEHAEACLENNSFPDKVTSDVEDGASHNQTSYSYIVNDTFSD